MMLPQVMPFQTAVCGVQSWRPKRLRLSGPGILPVILGLEASIPFHRPRHDDSIETFWIVTGREPYPNAVYGCILSPGDMDLFEKDAHSPKEGK